MTQHIEKRSNIDATVKCDELLNLLQIKSITQKDLVADSQWHTVEINRIGLIISDSYLREKVTYFHVLTDSEKLPQRITYIVDDIPFSKILFMKITLGQFF